MIGLFTVALSILFFAIYTLSMYYRQHKKNKARCLVWVNMQIIHDKPINNFTIGQFVGKTFDRCGENGDFYEKYIRKLAKGHLRKTVRIIY